MAAVGIEVEILLSPRDQSSVDETADTTAFAEWFVHQFNFRRHGRFNIHTILDVKYHGEEGIEWIMTDDATLELSKNSDQCELLIRHL